MKGKIVVTTQPADQAAEMLSLLEMAGARAYNLPMIETHTIFLPREEFYSILHQPFTDLLIFTSRKGVRGFFENLQKITGTPSLNNPVKIAVVGKSTAAEVENYGYKATYINPGRDAKDFAQYLLADVIQPKQRILLALGNKAPNLLEKTLMPVADVQRINVYQTIQCPVQHHDMARIITEKRADMIIFTSPSGFYAFLNTFKDIKGLHLAAIGTTTAAAIKDKGYELAVMAPYPSAKEMVAAIYGHFNNNP